MHSYVLQLSPVKSLSRSAGFFCQDSAGFVLILLLYIFFLSQTIWVHSFLLYVLSKGKKSNIPNLSQSKKFLTLNLTLLWFSKCGLGTSSISITQGPVGNANCQAPPQTFWDRNSWGWQPAFCFNNPFRWFWYMLKFDSNCLKLKINVKQEYLMC